MIWFFFQVLLNPLLCLTLCLTWELSQCVTWKALLLLTSLIWKMSKCCFFARRCGHFCHCDICPLWKWLIIRSPQWLCILLLLRKDWIIKVSSLLRQVTAIVTVTLCGRKFQFDRLPSRCSLDWKWSDETCVWTSDMLWGHLLSSWSHTLNNADASSDFLQVPGHLDLLNKICIFLSFGLVLFQSVPIQAEVQPRQGGHNDCSSYL